MKLEKKIQCGLWIAAMFLFFIAACGVEEFVELGVIQFILLYTVLLGGMWLAGWLAHPLRVRQLLRIFRLLKQGRGDERVKVH